MQTLKTKVMTNISSIQKFHTHQNDLINIDPVIFNKIAHLHSVMTGYQAAAMSLVHLKPSVKEKIAITVSTPNKCKKDVAVPSFLARQIGVQDSEIELNRKARSLVPKTNVILHYVKELVVTRGMIKSSSIERIKRTAVSDFELIEILAQVSMTITTTYLSHSFVTNSQTAN